MLTGLVPAQTGVGLIVISVIIKLHTKVVFRNIFSLNMKVSSILVISVVIKLQHRVIFRFT